MPIYNFTAGNPPPTAAQLNMYLIQQHTVFKTSNTSKTSTTTQANDPHLFMTVTANTTYLVELFLRYTGPPLETGGDINLRFTGPTGANFFWNTDALGVGATSATDSLRRVHQTFAATTARIATIGADAVALPKGVLVVGSTSGVFRMTWAQDVSSSTACTIYAGSFMSLRRMI